MIKVGASLLFIDSENSAWEFKDKFAKKIKDSIVDVAISGDCCCWTVKVWCGNNPSLRHWIVFLSYQKSNPFMEEKLGVYYWTQTDLCGALRRRITATTAYFIHQKPSLKIHFCQ